MRKNENPSFFDPKTLIAVGAVAMIYFGWQTYLGKKYPGYAKAPTAQTETKTPDAATGTNAVAAASPAEVKSEVVAPGAAEQTFNYANDKVSFLLTSRGMGLKNFTIKNYVDKDKNNIKLGDSAVDGLFELRWAGDLKPLEFHVTEQAPGHYVGTSQVGETMIRRELKFNAENSSFANTVTVTNPTEEFKKGFALLIPETIHVKGSSSIFFPSYEHQDFFVVHNGGKHETVNFSGAKENQSQSFASASILSVSSQYFAAAILDKSEIIPEIKVTSQVNEKTALAELVYKPVQVKPEMNFTEVFYAGPKSIDALKSVDPELAHIIDFGFLALSQDRYCM